MTNTQKNIYEAKIEQLERKDYRLLVIGLFILLVSLICVLIMLDPLFLGISLQSATGLFLIGLVINDILFISYVNSQLKLTKQLKNGIQTLNKLYKSTTTTLILSSRTEEALNHIAQMVTEGFKADYTSIMLVDKTSNKIKTKGLFGTDSQEIKNAQLDFGQSICGWVVSEGDALMLTDKTDYSMFTGYGPKRLDIKSALSLPLRALDRNIGVINITRLRTNPFPAFTEEDLSLLSSYAEYLAAHLEKRL